ncbi:MAG: IS4 family transposase [Paracoccaceae bacterium]
MVLENTIPQRYQNAPRDLNLYMIFIARLGGYLDRKNDPPPGTPIMWRGLSRLSDLKEGFRIGKSNAKQLVGN